ncbi:MAG TPA: carboxylating nicotinate-nucleotide diphosphorylase [Terriglobales bacterium]|nr:carboxylating nicotinate-nucleotide diphosphorylase [Terriglobales bacterium]
MDWNSRRVTEILANALLEDRATRDATTYACIDPRMQAVATVLAKQDFVLAGIGVIERVFEIFAELDGTVRNYPNITVNPEMFDGAPVRKGDSIAVVQHNARVILSCERVLLNVLQRLSGIATETSKYVEAVAGTKVKILDTRKTAPGLRVLEKYAVKCGGGTNHRLDLSDGILIKNNHIALAGGIAEALQNVHRNRRGEQPIEIEVRNLAELEDALENGAESILLDNMTPEQIAGCVDRARQHRFQIPLEASGGINLQNVRKYAEAGVDFISVGALTHSVKAVDISLRVGPV